MFGFAKSARANISRVEERDFKDLSKEVFSLSETTLQTLIKRGAFVPVKRDEKSKNL